MGITVGVKYCGGCNPHYDRKKYVQKLIDEHRRWEFCDADENTVYDTLYIVCGCDRRCAAYKKYNAKKCIVVTDTGEYT